MERAERHLTFGQSGYDHFRDLANGAVRVPGLDIEFVTLPIVELFSRFLKYREWHISELSLAKYVALKSRGETDLTAIPVFPSRVCRHSSIFVRDDWSSDVGGLRGARVGIPEWAQTAGVYARAVIEEEWGIGLDEMTWFQAGIDRPGREEKVPLELPAGVEVHRPGDRSLEDLFTAGELDCIISAAPPPSFFAGALKRLVPDYVEAEQEYVKRRGIFPIMHAIVLSEEAVAAIGRHLEELFHAFCTAKANSVQRLKEMDASRVPIGWMPSVVEAVDARFGSDLFAYGVEHNAKTLDAFLGWTYSQGVANRRLQVEELFVPGSASWVDA